MQLLNAAPDDAVSELLATLRVRSTVYCLSELREPWGFEVNGANVPKFHLVLAGSCWLDLPGHEPVQLQTGDLVILSRGERHVVSARPGSPVPSLDLIIASHPLDGDARLTYGGTGALTRLLCGGFVLDDPAPAALISLIPPLLQMNSRSADITAWLEPVFALMRQEADSACDKKTSASLAKIACAPGAALSASWRMSVNTGSSQAVMSAEREFICSTGGSRLMSVAGVGSSRTNPPQSNLVSAPVPP